MEGQAFMNIKRLIYTYIIVLEWIEGNEFDNSERVIIAGNILQGCIINYLFRNTTKKVYLCDIREFDKSYRHYRINWDSSYTSSFEEFKVFNCILVASASSDITPPRASISLAS